MAKVGLDRQGTVVSNNTMYLRNRVQGYSAVLDSSRYLARALPNVTTRHAQILDGVARFMVHAPAWKENVAFLFSAICSYS